MKNYGKEIPDGAVFAAASMFLDGYKVKDILETLNPAYGLSLSRQQIYPVMDEAVRRGFLKLTPPLEQEVRKELSGKFTEMPADTRVVNATEPYALDTTAQVGASVIYDLIQGRPDSGAPVSIGFGAGETMRRVSHHLARTLESAPKVPELTLVALTQGFTPQSPGHSPTTFLYEFHRLSQRTTVNTVGLFAEPMEVADKYEQLKTHPVVRQSYEAKETIDIVVTSCATATDDHSLLRTFLDLDTKSTGEDLKTLKKHGWVGDVLWRPYSNDGPIMVETKYRAVTLFEIEDLLDRKTKGKHTVVVAGPCYGCRKPKTAALLPLLNEESLRICNHLVLDIATANALLESES